MGKTYDAYLRVQREATQGNTLLEDRLLSLDPSADSTIPELNDSIPSENYYQLGDGEKLYEIRGSESRKKKLLIRLNGGTIRDVLRYWYFLNISDPMRARKVNLLKYAKFIFYRVDFETKIVLSLYLERSGNFISINASPKRRSQIQEIPPTKITMLDPFGIKKITQKMIHNIFDHVDQKKIEFVFRDLYEISSYDNISFLEGDIVVKGGQLLYELTIKCNIFFSLFLNPVGDFIGISFADEPKAWKQNIQEHYFKNNLCKINLFKNK